MVLAPGVAERAADQVDDAGLHHGVGEDRAHRVRQSFEAVTDQEEDVGHAAVFQLRQHCQPVLGRFAVTFTGPHAQHVTVSGQIDPDRGVDRPGADLAVADLDVQGVDEHRGVYAL
ncbi:hypothetical protein DL240490_03001 [Mycobacterium marinum]|nr:hypothetical protein DL240490_03001 [Mycobacterium marinum]